MILRYIKLVLLVILVLFGVSGWVYTWYRGPFNSSLYNAPRGPLDAPRIDDLSGVMVEAVLRNIEVYRPTEKQSKEIAKSIGIKELPPGELLGVFEVPPGFLTYGGGIIATLKEPGGTQGQGTPGGEAQSLGITIVPRERKFFEFGGPKELGIYYGWSYDEDQFNRVFSLEYRQSLFRTGPVIWEGKAGAMITPAKSIPYVMVGGKTTF